MMARLLTEEVAAASEPSEPGGKSHAAVPPRRLSFKTRQASARTNYRATKVSLSTTNVALIASKFNTIIIDDTTQGRALLRKLSGNQRKPPTKEVKMKTKGEGVVKAAIEIFEHHDSEKLHNKPPHKNRSDLRPKLVVVRKSSSRSSIKSGESEKVGLSNNSDSQTKETAKDIKNTRNKNSDISDITASATNIKEVKRKPSLKKKPLMRSSKVKTKDDDQRIAKFSKIDCSSIQTVKEVPILKPVIIKPTFNLNERIAQFNNPENFKTDHGNKFDTSIESASESKGQIFSKNDVKDNKQQSKKSILRNSYNNQPNLVAKTKDRLASIINQNISSNQHVDQDSDKKQSIIMDKFIVSEKKELKLFQSKVEKTTPLKEKDDYRSKLSVPKNASILDNLLDSKSSYDVISLGENEDRFSNNDFPLTNQSTREVCTVDIFQSKKTSTSALPSKDMSCTIKSTLMFSSEIAKKDRTNIPSITTEKFILDKIKPNNSFLWKPAVSVMKEVPIYDDRLESKSHNNVAEMIPNKTESTLISTGCEKDSSSSYTQSNLDLNVASSFIQEMTEQIERRFSSGSQQDTNTDNSILMSDEINENITKNSSFLHGKNSTDDVFSVISNIHVSNAKQIKNPAKCSTNLSHISKKPTSIPDGENLNLKLQDKKVSEELNRNLNEDSPPIPPSNTKPKLTHTLSEETWIETCKKILEIPPPLKNQVDEITPKISSVSQSMKVPLLEQTIQKSDRRFSVSQSELLRKISEMNHCNKRNSLPTSCMNFEEDDDHYSSIQHNNCEVHEQEDTYEAIGENSYAEIKEYSEEETNNIYDVVLSGELDQEDHYEAINCVLVQGDSDSSCDQSNSLYGLARPASLANTGSIYQVTGGSETSDEWVDLDNSDDQHRESVIIYRERDRGRGIVATESWSMKVRKQWSQKTADGEVRVSSESILYLTGLKNEQCHCLNDVKFPSEIVSKGFVSVWTSVCLCKVYEAQELTIYLGNEGGSDESVQRSYENIAKVDETTYCDDFDDSFSDSSFDNDNEAVNPHVQVFEKRNQPIAEGIYGLMKQAGKSMRKHWSLGKSLTRMKKNKSSPSIQTSSGSLGNRGWSFKSKDKPTTAQSTFYLHSTNTLPRAESQPDTKIDPRRLSTSSMLVRPTSPPPPPPPRNSLDETSKRKSVLNSSNNSSSDNEGYIEGQRRLSRNGNSMWYIETDSASEHGSSQGSDLNLRFADEPLYQFYAANVAEQTLSELVEEEEGEDGYEEITLINERPTALDLMSAAHHRSLWCEVPQVRNSGILGTLNHNQKKLQEAKFEVMTSEASYFKSLSVLDKLFASCPLFSDENILSRNDRKVLFGNVNTVRKCSEKLLAALQACWQDCILMQGICDVVHNHIKAHKDVYIKYCTNQISMDRTLKRLKQTNSNFTTVLTQLETDSECQSLTLYSFLMLPMQRITRLRLLIETMLSHLEPADTDFSACQKTLDVLNKCVSECNEGARSQERHEEMVKLSNQLEFPSEMNVPILSEDNSRWLVRFGQVTQVNMDAKHTFGRRLSRTGPKFTLFLFTDLFLVTKKKSEECYHVVDHCQRSLMETQEMSDFPGNNRFLIQVTLLENADNKTIEMTLSCDSETERQRWLQVLSGPQSQEPGETLYEGWDCPQVSVVHNYTPTQPDELTLCLGDVINVLRKSEGWFFGERTRDGEKGWFPGSYTREIASKHVRARNLKQRHRLLQLSADFVQQQRKIKS